MTSKRQYTLIFLYNVYRTSKDAAETIENLTFDHGIQAPYFCG
jgi:hypothetical protein